MLLSLVLAAPAHATPAEIAFVGDGGITAMRADGSERRAADRRRRLRAALVA